MLIFSILDKLYKVDDHEIFCLNSFWIAQSKHKHNFNLHPPTHQIQHGSQVKFFNLTNLAPNLASAYFLVTSSASFYNCNQMSRLLAKIVLPKKNQTFTVSG
jgi:hypothetical protein